MRKVPEDRASEEGIQIAAQLIDEIKGMAAGIHFYPPMNRFDMVVRLMGVLAPKEAKS
jgi:5,10-methylenetetrahydrofolate reductase